MSGSARIVPVDQVSMCFAALTTCHQTTRMVTRESRIWQWEEGLIKSEIKYALPVLSVLTAIDVELRPSLVLIAFIQKHRKSAFKK